MDTDRLILSPILCDGMILQRDEINYIYGKEMAAATVTVFFMGAEYCARTDENNDFCVELPPVAAGGPYTLTVKGSTEITLKDILFGDVYILSGQSNMELPLRRVLDVSAKEIKNTSEATIRQYHIPATYNFQEPEKYMCAASWEKAEGEQLLDFSAAGYFFAKEIKETYQVPVGLIMTAVGGSTIEAWMKPATLAKFGNYEKIVEDFKDIDYFNTYILEQQKQAADWASRIEEEEHKFERRSLSNSLLKQYRRQACDMHGCKFDILEDYTVWDTCRVPSLVSDYGAGDFQGSVYLCREVFLEEEQLSEECYLSMGSIIDSDRIWINQVEIGRTEYRYPPRKYKIRKGILRQGKNLITVRIVINERNGGTIKGKSYLLHYNNQDIDLEGVWYYRIGKKAERPMPKVLFPPKLPICFYHTVVVPLSRITVKGILWYQGESNVDTPMQYAEKFVAMVSDWRELAGREIPILYVQLPNYREPLNTTEDSGWAELREQQRQCLALDNVAMVTALDLGEANDLHPQNKKAIGIRLANAARALIYKEPIIYSGPIPQKAFLEGEKVRIVYQYLEDTEKECSLNHFEMAGEDGEFRQALAIRKGNCVYLTCEQIAVVKFVRYAWCDNPADINFYNEAGLPAAGFRLEL